MLGQIGKGFYHIMWELQGERLIGAAGCVAAAQRVFDQTLQYAQERKAFGRSIGKFQVIRHKFAEMATKIEGARQLVYTTAWRFANGEYPVREISMAKLHASRIAVEVADECIQIHGGAGYMKEYGVERAWRDLRLNRIGAGTDEIMLDVIGRSYGLRRNRRHRPLSAAATRSMACSEPGPAVHGAPRGAAGGDAGVRGDGAAPAGAGVGGGAPLPENGAARLADAVPIGLRQGLAAGRALGIATPPLAMFGTSASGEKIALDQSLRDVAPEPSAAAAKTRS